MKRRSFLKLLGVTAVGLVVQPVKTLGADPPIPVMIPPPYESPTKAIYGSNPLFTGEVGRYNDIKIISQKRVRRDMAGYSKWMAKDIDRSLYNALKGKYSGKIIY